MGHLQSLHIQGFKSIRDQRLEFNPLNVFIGGNGAGKSNLIKAFRLLHVVAGQNLQVFSGESGGANALLHFGRKTTQRIVVKADFRNGSLANSYAFSLIPTDDDRFLVEKEATYFHDTTKDQKPMEGEVWKGNAEAQLPLSKKTVARFIRKHLESFRIYHFHDTGSSAPVKQTGELGDNRFLRPDAGNLAAYLYFLQHRHPEHYRNIEDTIRMIAPFFGGFRLAPSTLNPDKIRLEWQHKDSDAYFHAASLSDGTLRFMCLATLLMQPTLPSVILIDEPELGLHPAAIQLLASLFKSTATRTQLIVGTQSVTLVNQLEPEHVWIVNRQDGESQFRHLAKEDMSTWLEEYSLGDLWEKNVIGGRP